MSGHGESKEKALHCLTMEAVERYSSVFAGDERLLLARASELSRCEFAKFFHHSRKQRSTRTDKIPVDDPWWVPEPCPPECLIRWTEARSLVTGEVVLVPAGFVYLGYGAEDEPLYTLGNSTGCAAGSSFEDAARRALLEAVERDALGIWWYNRVQRPSLDFSEDPALERIAAGLQETNRRLELLDITHDLGIPVVAAYSCDHEGAHIYIGAAADSCRLRAARHAASEMLQFWFWGAVSQDPLYRTDWLTDENLETQSWLRPIGKAPLGLEQEADSLDRVAALLTARSFEPLVVDLTRPNIGVPVVRALVPGLRSHLPHFGPGRLFEVSVNLGWISQSRKERELFRRVCPI